MAENDPDVSEGLAREREQRLHSDAELREKIMSAVLAACGELGYRRTTVAAVLERYGGYRLQFYRQFASLAEGYAAAYASQIERLSGQLLAAGASSSSWRGGLRAALKELGAFALQQPLLAHGLLVGVHVAGGPALEQRQEVLERLSRALDSARRETGSRHSPPPLTAPLMVRAIEAAVVRALAKGEPELFVQALPELEQLVSSAYFGHGVNRA